MVLRRRESAGARVGQLARFPDGSEATTKKEFGRPGRSCLLRARVPQADAQFYVVGKPQRCVREEHLPGWFSRARQHRCVRPKRTVAHWWIYQSIGWNQLDGDVQPES